MPAGNRQALDVVCHAVPTSSRGLPAVVHSEVVITRCPWIIQRFASVLLKQLAAVFIQIGESLEQGRFPTAIAFGALAPMLQRATPWPQLQALGSRICTCLVAGCIRI